MAVFTITSGDEEQGTSVMNPAAVRLYILETAGMEDPARHPEWEPALPAGRWRKAAGMIALEDRRNCAGAGWLLRHVFREEGIPFSADAFSYGKHGKPYSSALFFNLSHSGQYVICAVGRREIGCDIQIIKPCRDAMARRFFAPEEQAYLFSAKGTERDARFIRLWCRKESLLKRSGEGLTRELRDISCLTGEDFYEMEMAEYRICLCSEELTGDEGQVSVHIVSPEQCVGVL